MPERLRRALRLLATWLFTALALRLADLALPGLDIDTAAKALLLALVIGLLNAIVWPLVVRFALPLVVITVGLATLAINGAVLWLASLIVDGVDVSFGAAVVASIVVTLVSTLLSALFAVDDDDSFQRNVVRRLARRRGTVTESDVPGLFFLEIDGLSEPAFIRALGAGHLPTLARWLQEGSHRIVPWETDLSSQTGASQAGLLQGSNGDMPAFRWYEKDAGRTMVSNHPGDAAEIERRHSNGRGLLAAGGASRGNLLSGDAPRTLMTMSTLRTRERLAGDIYAYFAHPYGFTRTLLLSLWDVLLEWRSRADQRRRDVRPRLGRKRGGVYPLLRVSQTVVCRDVNIASLVSDVTEGVPVAYSTFVAYDEVAHHSGVERPDALAVLQKLERQFARVARAAESAPRPYKFVVLSDHGQSQGATFLQRYGKTLEDVVREAAAEGASVEALEATDEGWAEAGAAVASFGAGKGAVAGAVRAASKSRTVEGGVMLGEAREEAKRRKQLEGEERPDVVVMPSGNLALIYLLEHPGRMTREQIEAAHPALLAALAAHPGVGFVMVETAGGGGVALGARGTHWLAQGRVEGEDPLAVFGANAARHLRRTNGFAHAPDILVNSFWDPVAEEGAAFEELVGFHGGLGGPQNRAFAFAPAELAVPAEPIVGAEAMHRVMVSWLRQVGQDVPPPAGDGAAPVSPPPSRSGATP